MGKRISDMRLDGKPIEADKSTRSPAGRRWRRKPRKAGNKPVWEVVEQWLKTQGGTVKARKINMPKLVGVQGNPGLA